MQIESNSAYLASLYTRVPHTAANTDTKQASTQASSVSQETAVAVTGNVTRLSPETVQYMIQQQVREGRQPDTSEKIQQRYSELRQEHFHRIATDSDYAAKQAQLLGKSQDGLLIPNEVFKAYAASGRGDELGYALNDPNNPVLKVQKQRTAFYEREVAQGVPPAQIVTDLLKFNLSLPDSYTDGALDRTNSYPPGYYKSLQQNDLDMLSTAMASLSPETIGHPQSRISQGNVAATSVKTADSAKETGAPNTDTDNYDGPLPIGTRHGLDDIANDPAYAAQRAEDMGTLLTPIVVNEGELPFPGNNAPLQEKEAWLAKWDRINAANEKAFAPRKGLYESKKAEGVSPAQIYADLLAFNTSQTEYNALADKMQGKPEGYRTSMYKAQHDYLQNLIDQGGAATASVKTADSTKVEG